MNIEQSNAELGNESAIGILKWVYDKFDVDKVKLSTSFGAEGMVLLSMMSNLVENPKLFTIDTGRNFQETYDIWDEVIKSFNVEIEVFNPSVEDIQDLIHTQGPNMFYRSVENWKKCCTARKVKPLRKALKDADVWITGLRKEQNENRSSMEFITWSEEHQVYKICPLLNWTEQVVWEYIRNNSVPYNKLHDQGYRTIGCAPCTRPVRPAENIRAGRWWWEESENKECGLHVNDESNHPKVKILNYQI